MQRLAVVRTERVWLPFVTLQDQVVTGSGQPEDLVDDPVNAVLAHSGQNARQPAEHTQQLHQGVSRLGVDRPLIPVPRGEHVIVLQLLGGANDGHR